MRRALWRGGAGGRQGRAEGRPAGPAAPGAAVGAASGRPLKPSGGRFALRAVSLHCGRGVRGAGCRPGDEDGIKTGPAGLCGGPFWFWLGFGGKMPRGPLFRTTGPGTLHLLFSRYRIGWGSGQENAGFLCRSDNVIVAQRRREGKKEWHLRHNQSCYCQFFFQNHPECDIILHNTRNRREQYGKNCGMR